MKTQLLSGAITGSRMKFLDFSNIGCNMAIDTLRVIDADLQGHEDDM